MRRYQRIINGDAKTKEDLRKAMHTTQAQHHSVYELTDKSFAVFGPVKASNELHGSDSWSREGGGGGGGTPL